METPVKTSHPETIQEVDQLIDEDIDKLEERLKYLKVRKALLSKPDPRVNQVPVVEHRTVDDDRADSDARLAHMLNICMGLPKREVPKFSGNPMDYWNFYRSFTSGIEKYTSDPYNRLSYLISFCDGEARRAIEHCTILDPLEGYTEAWSILRRCYGQSHRIARQYITALTEGPVLNSNDDRGLVLLAEKMKACEITLKELNYTAELDTPSVIGSIVNRLPVFMQTRWFDVAADILSSDRPPTFSDLTEFIRRRSEAASVRAMYHSQSAGSRSQQERRPREPMTRVSTLTTSTTRLNDHGLTCMSCGGAHYVDVCPVFIKLGMSERKRFVKTAALCSLCLKPRHDVEQCRSRKCCNYQGCREYHHPLLHEDAERSHVLTSSINRVLVDGQQLNVSLAVVPVEVIGPGRKRTINALLDSGSDSTLITRAAAEMLGLTGEPTTLCMATLGGERTIKSETVRLKITTSLHESANQELTACIVPKLPELSTALPSEKTLVKWDHLKDIPLRRLNEPVSMLIGMDTPLAHWALECRFGKPNEPYAVLTPLGWVVMGPTGLEHSSKRNAYMTIARKESADALRQQLENLYNEEFTERDCLSRGHSCDDQHALSLVESGARIVNGRFQIPLPWKPGKPDLPSNLMVALKRINSLRARLVRDTELYRMYTEAVNGYIAKGHAEPAGKPVAKRTWYLPHHPVVNPNKPGKVRVVFDCASQLHGTSLNGQLSTGPDLVSSLIGVLLRFRQYKHVVSADVEAMFHQVKVPQEDRDALRFLWWKDNDILKAPESYRMTVHPFGATSSPFCASWALKKAINSSKDDRLAGRHSEAERAFYVDDFLYSSPDEEDLVGFSLAVRDTLEMHGFKLSKWSSNSAEVCSRFKVTDSISVLERLNENGQHWDRALGVRFEMSLDVFSFNVTLDASKVTKRKMLSCIASVYDPLGFVGPVILPGRLLFRQLCQSSVGWDENLHENIVEQWRKWMDDLRDLARLRVPRCLTPEGASTGEYQLHCFSDASESAYGAVVYLRTLLEDGSYHCSFVCGKSRVAPIKNVSIPRMELVAALLSARIASQVRKEFTLNISSTVFWTDSMVVLKMLRNTTTRFQCFVANRISAIHDLSPVSQWRFVDGRLNPADVASRGTDAKQLNVSNWLCGPNYLCLDEKHWPEESPRHVDLPEEFIRKRQLVLCAAISSQKELLQRLSCFSSWSKLLRSVSWLRRFCDWINGRWSHDGSSRFLSTTELKETERQIIKLVQHSSFVTAEHSSLEASIGSIRKLKPFVQDGILRVGGRLQWAVLQYDAKHPMILPSDHFVTRLIVKHYHEKNGHVGASQVLNDIRQRYWILRGHATVRRTLLNCIPCRRWFSKPCLQAMAPLLADRTRIATRPFSYTGLDYFGPVLVKKGRGTEKRYGCVFTCMTLRAVHVEVANTLETDSFLCAFTRFAARRGNPCRLYSDNGTNFRGAEAEIRACMKTWNHDKISKRLLQHECDWIFTTPRASHQGGAWERMIRSIRRILRSLLGERLIDDEMLRTSLAEVEKIINSRPLVKVTTDPNDLQALTPSHLLLLEGNSAENTNLDSTSLLTRRWRASQQIADQFWKRWVKEYLPTLQTVSKWLKRGCNLKVGDLVLVEDSTKTRGRWPKGVVEAVKEAADGLVREVTVRTASGVLRRDVRQLYLLEMHEHAQRDDSENPRDGPAERLTRQRVRTNAGEGAGDTNEPQLI